MASRNDQESHTIVPTMALITFLEASLALINGGLIYLPDNVLEHVSVHLERATIMAIQETRARCIRTPESSAASPATSASRTLTPLPLVKEGLRDLEAQVQCLSIKGAQLK